MGFFPDHIHMLQEAGHTVELACNMDKPLPDNAAKLGCVVHHIPFSRSPFSSENMAAYHTLKRLLTERHYDIIHTHTPNASALVRLACRSLRKTGGPQVFYTAHGFHFYKGAPLKNWMIYYPVERLLSRWTDVLITMNREDFARAQSFHAGRTELIHGVGIDLARFEGTGVACGARAKIRDDLGIGPDETLLLSVGELIPRKNHETLLKALAKTANLKIKLAIAGTGPLEKPLKALALTLDIKSRALFLGYRNDIPELCRAADIFVFPSLQEGLPVALMEAMASGLPVAASRIRGNVDLLDGTQGGRLVPPCDAEALADAIRALLAERDHWEEIGSGNRKRAAEFSTGRVLYELSAIYRLPEPAAAGRGRLHP